MSRSVLLNPKDYGYEVRWLLDGELVDVGQEYDLVNVGDILLLEDQILNQDSIDEWRPIREFGKHIGRDVLSSWRPLRRKIGVRSQRNYNRWSCSHRRLPEDNSCPVCRVWFNRWIEE